MINFHQLNPFKKIFYGLKARLNRFNPKIKFIQMRNASIIIDPISNRYIKNQSYKINLFDFKNQSCLTQWESITDKINGGSSTAQLYYNPQNQSILYKGYVQTKDKDRMIQYPFINIARTYPVYFKLGPMRLCQIQVKTDGKPLQIHFNFKSFIKGQVNIYGFLLSKSTQWKTYEIPIQNMILRGTQQDYHDGQIKVNPNPTYFSRKNQSSVFDKEFQSVKKILNSEIPDQDSIELQSIGFRLVSTQSEERQIQIRKINFCYREGFQKFVDEYQSPYFYITNDKTIKNKQLKNSPIQFLSTNLQEVNLIDTGDLKYYRKEQKNKNKKSPNII